MPNDVGGLPHILLVDTSTTETFVRPGTGGQSDVGRVPDRERHASHLLEQMSGVLKDARAAMHRRSGRIPANANGYYLKVDSRPNEPLLVEQFEGKRAGVELLSVKEDHQTGITTASLFVPERSAEFLGKKIETYRTKTEPRSIEGMPKFRRLIEGIGDLAPSSLQELWIDPLESFPARGEIVEWEVWLREGALERFRADCAEQGIEIGTAPLRFPEDSVIWAACTVDRMEELVGADAAVARLGRAKRNSEFPLSGSFSDQNIVLEELLQKLIFPETAGQSVCVLDTGVSRTHPLISPLVPPNQYHAYDPAWGSGDHRGHGTKVASICAFGDLRELFHDDGTHQVPYTIESVNIFPPSGSNPHDLLGVITAGAVATAELANPAVKRVFCLATTTDEDTPHGGHPTSWSSELDQLSSGALERGSERRLFSVSAGNIRTQVARDQYPYLNDLSELEAPSHAWNVLCVGATTAKDTIESASHAGWTVMATAGDLAPTSRTASWNKTWPIKPDVVFEGGNLGVDPADGFGYGVDELKLVTTSAEYPAAIFDGMLETSAAVAGVARLTAHIQNRYPSFWPETIRALVLDSAEWTDAMRNLLPVNPVKSDYIPLLRRYGFGVPSFVRAIQSASNDLTMIEQSWMKPYARVGKSDPKLNEMKLFSLPWPTEALEGLGNEPVSLKVTLSYFIEPNPAESARNRASRYASHGFRFAVKLPDETTDEFRKRVNKAAREEEDPSIQFSDSHWMLGPAIRDRGSIHCDIWRGPASDLARRSAVAVYPVGGWWKDRPHLEKYDNRGRFSLVMRIMASNLDVDLYTSVTNRIVTETEI